MGNKISQAIIRTLRKITIKRRLTICFISISVVPVLLIGGICSVYTFYKMEAEASEYSKNLTQQMIESISSYFEKYLNSLEKIASDDTLVQDLMNYRDSSWTEKEQIENRIRIMMGSTFGFDKEIATVEIATVDDLRFYFTSPISSGDFNGENSSVILARAIQTDLTSHLIRTEIKSDEKDYLIVSKRIVNQNEEVIGVILLALNREFINKVYDDHLSIKGSNLMLIDQHQQLVSTSDPHLTEASYQKIIREVFSVIPQSDSDSHQIYQIKNINQDMMIALGSIEKIDWNIINVIPYSFLMESTWMLIVMTLLIAILMALMAFKLSQVITRSLTLPVDHLIEAMSHENLERRLKDDGADEYSVLIHHFNEMNNQIHKTIHDVYKLQLKKSELDALKKEMELSALQEQINPHFLYNTLESIYWNGQLEGDEELSEMVLSLGDYLRTIINKGREYISIQHEMTSTNNYLFLQNKRFDNRIHHQWNYDQSITEIHILKSVLQPIIEDIVTCCVEKVYEDIHFIITITQSDEQVQFLISGEPVEVFLLSREKMQEERQPGWINVDQRLNLYFGKTFGVKLDLSNSTIQILCPVMKLPLDE